MFSSNLLFVIIKYIKINNVKKIKLQFVTTSLELLLLLILLNLIVNFLPFQLIKP